MINPYSHFPLAANVEEERFVMVMKWWAEEMMEGRTEIIHLCMSNLTSAVHAVILRTEGFFFLNWSQSQLNTAPSDPASPDDLVLPE